MHPKVETHILDNGLTILTKELHHVPLVSHWVWYRVGSRNETKGKTGISHWVEHMQFKGTPKYPVNVLDQAISRDGGVWNAMTSLDWTTYFETLPSHKIDIALDLEADRMLNSLFDKDETELERTVVISEREGNENEPLFRLGEAVQQAAFEAAPLPQPGDRRTGRPENHHPGRAVSALPRPLRAQSTRSSRLPVILTPARF